MIKEVLFSHSIDIFHAYVALLKQTKTALLPQLALAAQNNSNDTEMMDLGEESGSANKLMRQVKYMVIHGKLSQSKPEKGNFFSITLCYENVLTLKSLKTTLRNSKMLPYLDILRYDALDPF